jgi:hypothetical protein
MAKIELFGKITEVFPLDFVGANKTAKQEFVLFVPGYVDQFDRDKPVYDEDWLVTIFGGEKVMKYQMTEDTVGRKCKVKVFLNSKRIPAKEAGGKDFFPVSVNVDVIEMLP